LITCKYMLLLRKLTLCLLVLPLTLNGLWMICRDVPPAAQAPDSAQSSTVDQQKAECERLCARQSSLCLTSGADKTSVTIIVYGVAVFPAEIRIGAPSLSRQTSAELRNLHSDPNIAQPSPPPRA
jgi:hypothetical protein